MLRLLLPFIVLALAAVAAPCRAADPAIPNFWDTKERLAKPDISELQRVRFLTTVDFPPFNFLDTSGRLSGFHVDLARAICRKLEIVDKCQIQALPWGELQPALQKREGEAIIAGIAVTEENRAKLRLFAAVSAVSGALHHAEGQGADRTAQPEAEGRTRRRDNRVGA